MIQNVPLRICAACGEWLYDGDTIYELGGRTYCCACVRAALTVCRPAPPEIPRIRKPATPRKTGGPDDLQN